MLENEILILVVSMIFFVALPVSIVVNRLNNILDRLEEYLNEKNI